MKPRNILFGAVIAGSAFCYASAKADLIGNSIGAEQVFGIIQCSFCSFSTNPFTVQDPGVETVLSDSLLPAPHLLYNVDFAATSLTINFLVNVQLAGGDFNGPVFSVLLGNPFDPIGAVSGIDPFRVTETNGKLFVDLQSYQTSTDTPIVIKFDAVPGPMAGAGLPGLLLACAGLLAWWRRKKPASVKRRRLMGRGVVV